MSYTVGQARDERRLELIAILEDALVLLNDGGVLDRPYELDAVSASLHFAQPIADRLAQKPHRVSAFERITGIPVIPVAGYTGPPMFLNDKGIYPLAAD